MLQFQRSPAPNIELKGPITISKQALDQRLLHDVNGDLFLAQL